MGLHYRSGFDAGPLAEVISKFTPVTVPYKDPIDWTKVILISAIVPIFGIFVRFFGPVITNRWVWATGTILTTLVMTSGYMFVRIRSAPWTGGGGNWIAAGHQNQYGQEIQVISFICEFIALNNASQNNNAPLRRSPWLLLPHVDHGCASPKVGLETTCTDLPLDWCYYDHVLRFGVCLQS